METQTSPNLQSPEAQAPASTTTQHASVPSERNYGWDNVSAENGVEISIFGMVIVFTGLVLTFAYISLLPLLSGKRKSRPKPARPDTAESTAQPHPSTSAPASLSPELQAVIAYVIAAEQEYEQLTDYTKLTIRRDENQQAWGVAGKMRTLATRKLS